MTDDEVRARLEERLRARGLNLAAASRAIGRNPAYLQQFLRRGVPRRLPEAERRALARLLDMDEAELGAPPELSPAATVHVVEGVTGPDGRRSRSLPFDRELARSLSDGRPERLVAYDVEGDAMAPTLRPGDQVLACALPSGRLRDGLHLLAVDRDHLVRRLALNPVSGRVAILCDNPAYPPLPEQDPSALSVLGRVVWLGRRLD
ncbi:MAG: S24 family peptidase [Sphingomonadaceae bacterium]|uniref:S24 family peptidase n=1 Tax=Thermaurantiacus sp. TaxID=2820283 RepID=UPI00298F1F90|nr:S24 family peptidase [Thermaurantiacus sp.]MCS6986607.1 S24 family peptidase [Sphingomonadaceae bacterium]MDW8414132.1 S24 family peptidase [Thermaurantiacus sp.]